MRIEKLFLHNYCQHENLELNFSPGMNVIVGPIGSGKSNILKAIRFAFTNDSGNPGSREDDVLHGLPDGQRSGVHVVASHGLKRFVLGRNIRPASRSLQWDGEGVITADKAISHSLSTKLGIDPDLFDEIVIIPQGQMASVLNLTDTARTELMHKLVGLSKYSKLYSWFSPYISELAVGSTVLDPVQALNLLNENKEAKKKHEAEIAEAKAQLPEEALLNEAESIFKHKNLVDSLQQKIADWSVELAKTEPALVQAKDLEAASKEKVTLLAQQTGQKQKEWDSANANIELARAYEERKRLEAEMQRVSTPEPPPKFEGEGYIPPQVDLAHAERQQLAVLQHVKKLLTTHSGVCPTCLRPMEKAVSDVDAEIAPLEKLVKSHDECFKKSREFDDKWAWNLANEARRLAEYPQIEAAFNATLPCEYPGESAATFLAQRSTLTSQLSDLRAQLLAEEEYLKNVSIVYSKLQVSSKSLSIQIENAKEELSKLSAVDSTKYDAAMLLLQNVQDLKGKITAATGSLSVIDSQMPKLEANYQKALESQRNHASLLEFRRQTETARGVFHRDSLPAEMAKKGMAALAEEMNKSLSKFGANFRVHAGSGSAFRAGFHSDSRKGLQTDNRLSGGERAQFGLASIVAVHTMWAQELGFLAMDEPTYGFGQNDMGCVQKAIEQLNDLSKSQGLQVIVVTHEKSLLNAFDNVIRIGM
jgi:DNA repair exonuclease SbcCD ATPase subunit